MKRDYHMIADERVFFLREIFLLGRNVGVYRDINIMDYFFIGLYRYSASWCSNSFITVNCDRAIYYAQLGTLLNRQQSGLHSHHHSSPPTATLLPATNRQPPTTTRTPASLTPLTPPDLPASRSAPPTRKSHKTCSSK
jgi:hypothetical protein